MTKKPVKYQFDPSNLPPLTRKQKAELPTLTAMPDKQIDTSDIAPLTEEFWKNSTCNPFYRPIKRAQRCALMPTFCNG